MKNILIIFQKELKDVLRDRRTLLAMMVFPLLLVPSILSISTSMQASQSEKAMNKMIKIAVIDNSNGSDFIKTLRFGNNIEVFDNVKEEDLKEFVKGDSLDGGVVISTTFDDAIKKGRSGVVEYYFNSTDEAEIKQRIESSFEFYRNGVLTDRLDSLGVDKSMMEPLKVIQKDVYTEEESLGKMIGGFMPYIFVLFCLMGAMYPAIDLFTGEKERGTMETILTVPANRLEILLGKMGVVVITGVISGLMAIIGMYAALKLNPDAPEFFINMINNTLKPLSVTLIILMLIPLTTFFGGAMIPLAIYAKSFKEAQSMIQPAVIIVIMPLVIAMLPGMELNIGTAFIPILNVALASKEIIAGTIDYGLLAVVFASLITFAGIGIALSIRQFGQESNILR